MKIGLISDTHDNLPNIVKAVNFFNTQKIGFLLHAGDFVAPFAVARLKGLLCDWRGVFGNNDGEKNGLALESQGRIREAPLRIELDKRKIALVHDVRMIDPFAEDLDICVFGHTHTAEMKTQSNTLIVNPGECGGWLTGKSTVAVLDLASLKVELFKV